MTAWAFLERRCFMAMDDHSGHFGPFGGGGADADLPGIFENRIPATIAVLVVLFAVQNHGLGLGRQGIRHRDVVLVRLAWRSWESRNLQAPEILGALNPYVGIHYLLAHRGAAMVVLGSVSLRSPAGRRSTPILGTLAVFRSSSPGMRSYCRRLR